jgi:hypothetical protein
MIQKTLVLSRVITLYVGIRHHHFEYLFPIEALDPANTTEQLSKTLVEKSFLTRAIASLVDRSNCQKSVEETNCSARYWLFRLLRVMVPCPKYGWAVIPIPKRVRGYFSSKLSPV